MPSLNAANGVFLVSLAAGYGRGLALLRHGRGIRGRWIHAFCLCLWPRWPFTGGGVAVAEGVLAFPAALVFRASLVVWASCDACGGDALHPLSNGNGGAAVLCMTLC